MLYDTHLAGGVLSGAAVLFLTGAPPETWPGALFLAGLASVLPDVDHGRAALNQALRKSVPMAGAAVNTAARAVLGHRAATHSLLALVGVATLFRLAVPVSAPLFWAALAGYLSHLVLDSFNPQGVWWTWPFGRRWSLREVLPWPFTFETGSRVEAWFLRPALWLGAVLLIARCLGVANS
ncbi:metal-dependent hydrolase [Desulfofundulus thermosubterraneus]|uniref:Inner membrane protein n=1 Tax=Desulfofundulus thermosubterraneus DSM 16057 TaxID=1121432 RepID=A0A1M6JDV3_9FIRM|nr:metal-dependent hydrolase [Desulfofundulus thermosubterraneus]SHJ44858.1 inner membrane protein [Desulfofundulus thermosubterraneus DSM 16057]